MASRSRRSLSSGDYLENLRKTNRKRYYERRQKCKNTILKRKRKKFTEVEESLEDMTAKEVRQLAQSIKKTKPSVETLQQISRGVCGGKDHIIAFFSVEGAFNVVLSCLTSNNGEKQLEAATVLTNLACGTHKSTRRIAKFAGAYLVSHMSGSNHYLQSQCAWVAGNVVEDCEYCFNTLNSQGLLSCLLLLLKSPHPDVLNSAVFCLNACLAYFEEASVIHFVELDLMEYLVKLMQKPGQEDSLIADACTALSRCCFIAASHNKQILNESFADALIKSLENVVHPENNDIFVATPLMRCLGYTCFSSHAACQYVASYRPFHFLVTEIMNSNFYHLKKELVWVLTNILATTGVLLEEAVITPVIKKIAIFLSPIDSSVLQALYFLCVLSEKGYNQLLLSNGVSEQVVLLHLTCSKKHINEASNVFLNLLKSQ